MLDLRLCLFSLALIAGSGVSSEPVSAASSSSRIDPATFRGGREGPGSPGTGLPHNLVLVLVRG